MHVVRVVRVLLVVLIVAVVVGAGSSVLSARPDLDKAKHNVDLAWSSLSVRLDHRYLLLAAVDDKLRPVPGPIHTVATDLDAALAHWRDVRQNGSVTAQVDAANDVEALARRVVATAGASPRVKNDDAVLTAIGQFLDDGSRGGAASSFNTDVVHYEHERRGPVRTVVASVLGDGTIPVLDTSQATPTTTPSA
ncbi:MAG TPA: hypothetical protein VL119_11795 [Acidimicrobiia bacterium]|nr:hypothetical protein [Acidimicrobiia bacterium]